MKGAPLSIIMAQLANMISKRLGGVINVNPRATKEQQQFGSCLKVVTKLSVRLCLEQYTIIMYNSILNIQHLDLVKGTHYTLTAKDPKQQI